MGSSSSSEGPPLVLPQQEVVRNATSYHVTGMASATKKPVPTGHAALGGTTRMPLVWEKTFSLERVPKTKHRWVLSTPFKAEVPCELAAFFHCRESAGFEFETVGSAPQAFRTCYGIGNHTVKLDGDNAIDTKYWPLETFWKYNTKPGDIFPIVFRLRSSNIQSVLGLALSVSSDRTPHVKCLWHKVSIEGQQYTLQEIYGMSEFGKESKHDETAVGEHCVICLSEPRNTAILPCRHLCVCDGCGELLGSGAASTCPICRGTITGVKAFELERQ